MTHAREMLDTHPGSAAMDAGTLVECIEACFGGSRCLIFDGAHCQASRGEDGSLNAK
jgi:hypothetical protein